MKCIWFNLLGSESKESLELSKLLKHLTKDLVKVKESQDSKQYKWDCHEII